MENLVNEIWKDMPGFEEQYEVSNLGKIRSKNYCIVKPNGWVYNNKSRIIKSRLSKRGYSSVCLYKNSKKHTKIVHRIVAKAFVPNPHNKSDVNHINGIKTDNRIDNLEWTTGSENIKHALNIGLKARGSKSCKAKLNEEQVIEIRKTAKFNNYKGYQIDLANKFGVSPSIISAIVVRRVWKHLK